MNIFMTNDDGFDSPLLLGLAKTLSKTHNITIVAIGCSIPIIIVIKAVRFAIAIGIGKTFIGGA